jgi:hypothetical protein
MIGGGGRLVGLPVSAQVRTHDPVPAGGQQQRYPIPGGVGTRMPVQQYDRRSCTTLADPQPHTPRDLDHPLVKPGKHAPDHAAMTTNPIP